MTDTLALEYLFDQVVARFAADSTVAANYFGWREPPKQLGVSGGRTARIVWRPGDPNGSVGAVQSPRGPGATPARPLGDLKELFTVEITAADNTAPENERKQYAACRLLFDAWYRAVYLKAGGSFVVQSANWLRGTGDSPVRRHGATMQVVCTILAKIPDIQYTTAPVDTDAEIESSLEDVDETLTIPAP